MVAEHWRPVVGFDQQYEVSNHGRVRNRATWRVLSPRSSPNSGRRHVSVYLCAGGVRQQAYVHVLVLFAFHGPRPENHDARHLDGDAQNNRIDNLQWATRSRNVQDYKWHGKPRKLRTEQVASIKSRLAAGETQAALAREYGVWPNTIRCIRTGRAHRDV